MISVAAVGAALVYVSARAEEKLSFANDIRPILNRNCTGCHGGVKMAGDVSFIYRDLALGKGKSGKSIIVPGKPEASELIRRVETRDPDDVMPPAEHGKPLSEEEVALLKRWIREGAEWEQHWAFVAPQKPSPPALSGDWGKTEIDAYVYKAMREKGLEPNGEANASVLLRRLKFDLLGLPPSVAELDAFEKAYERDAESAWKKVVEEYLADPGYGERWASVWMDLARYADSEGLGVDRKRDVWPYRDWLIKAYNEDMRFDTFTVKQLAGDLVENPSFDDRVATVFHRLTQANEEGGTDDEEFRVAAVMDRVNTTWEVWQGQTFGCTQCHSHPYDPFEHEEYFKFSAFFNNSQDADLSNHAPVLRVPQDQKHYAAAEKSHAALLEKEARYYGRGRELAAQTSWEPVKVQGVKVNKGKAEVQRVEKVSEVRTVGTVASRTHFTIELDGIDSLTALKLEILPEDGEAAASTPNWGAVLSYIELRVKGGKRDEEVEFVRPVGDHQEIGYRVEESLNKKSSGGWGPYTKIFHPRWAVFPLARELSDLKGETLELRLEFNQRYLASFPLVAKRIRVYAAKDDQWSGWAKSEEVRANKDQLEAASKAYLKFRGPSIPVMLERDPSIARKNHVFDRGNWLEKGKVIEKAGTPHAFPKLQTSATEPNRLDMARWLVSDENPLSSRVVVNRFWHQLFGRGIVETLEDLGSSGEKPSHPELLDYLAWRFQHDHEWSQKAMLREIVMSKVYRQSAVTSAEKREKDPRNVYMSYGSRRRLRAEAVRDSSLHVAGLLHEQLYGAPVYPPLPAGVWKPFHAADKWRTAPVGDSQRYRRALYTYWKRSIPYPALMSFDTPSREVCSKRRLVSNTPIAALTSMNDEAFAECAKGLARRMKYETDGDVREKISFGYRVATSREPSDGDLADLVAAYRDMEAHYRSKPALMKGMAGTPDGAAFTVMASLLLNLDAALTK
ncbi:DUF1553 domain-containing protein [Rubritalea tangerina]|uniref:DUF1553 domain-containing protein n=1 Tax=Rubritalea tangerina TaxID=430798 RepID=A0ABW4ZCX0_9BACT